MKRSVSTPVDSRPRISMSEFATSTRTWFQSDPGEAENPLASSPLQDWLEAEERREHDAARHQHASRWRRRAVTAVGILLLAAAFAFASHLARNDTAREQMRRWLTMERTTDAP